MASQRWWVIEYGNVRVSLCLCGFYVISYEQTTQTIHLKHSQPLSICLCRVLTSSASSAGVQEAEVEGTRSQSPICLPVAMGKPLATHTEASTKLITAHQAHHCDDHPRSQSRDFFSLTKHRARIHYAANARSSHMGAMLQNAFIAARYSPGTDTPQAV